MATVQREDLRPGMILASDLKKDGRMLLPAGIELNQNHLQLFERMDVAEADVAADPSGISDEIIDQACEYVQRFFLYVDNDFEASKVLFQVASAKLVDKMVEGWDLPDIDELSAASVEHLDDIFLKDEGGVEDVVNAEVEAASFPDIYFKIRQVLEDDKASAHDVSQVVSTDVGLSARLLQLVNSPFYGFPSRVDSISRAVALVGLKELSTLALGISTINYFKDIPPELMDMKSFWKHSLSCGILAKILAKSLPGASPERFFTAGLLHDVGRLVQIKKMPYSSAESMLFARENAVPLVMAEETVLGFNHAEISQTLLERWNFPESLSRLIPFHHTPTLAAEPRDAVVLQIADNLSRALEISERGMYVLPGIDPEGWELTGFKPETLIETSLEHDKQIDEVLSIFLN